MDCQMVEQRLSEYMESSLPAEEMDRLSRHIESCHGCSALSLEMAKALSLCHTYPEIDLNGEVVDKILLRTSGRPRTRSIRKRLQGFFRVPILTPRFAAGLSLAAVFLVVSHYLLLPPVSSAYSHLSPQGLSNSMDRGVRRLYGEGLKVYETANEWQERISFFRTSTINKLKTFVDRLDEPVEGRKEEGREPQKDRRSESGSRWLIAGI